MIMVQLPVTLQPATITSEIVGGVWLCSVKYYVPFTGFITQSTKLHTVV